MAVDYGAVHFYVASDVGIALTRTAIAKLQDEVVKRLASLDPAVKREGLILFGAIKGLQIVLESDRPGPSGIDLQIEVKHILRNNNPSRDEMHAIMKKIHDTLTPIWTRTAESKRQQQIKNIQQRDARGSRPLR